MDDFIKKEELKMAWFDKLFGNYPKVKTTKYISDTVKHHQFGEKK